MDRLDSETVLLHDRKIFSILKWHAEVDIWSAYVDKWLINWIIYIITNHHWIGGNGSPRRIKSQRTTKPVTGPLNGISTSQWPRWPREGLRATAMWPCEVSTLVQRKQKTSRTQTSPPARIGPRPRRRSWYRTLWGNSKSLRTLFKVCKWIIMKLSWSLL